MQGGGTAVDNAPAITTEAAKFQDPDWTARGEPRASVSLHALKVLWFNTGSLCNITCASCYIESSPRNDRLAYLTAAEVASFLDEIGRGGWPVAEIGFTGGEPFMNRDLLLMIADALDRGFQVIVLTNAMQPLKQRRHELLALPEAARRRLTLRVSMDHYRPEHHEAVRGTGTWAPMLDGIRWLHANGFSLAVAGRTLWAEPESEARRGYAALFAAEALSIDAADPDRLVLFPEMDEARDVPEISTGCWDILGVSPAQMMCATSRMVVKRKGAATPVVVPCTLLPYDERFELGETLSSAAPVVKLNHRFCAQFCVLGGGSCARMA
jgi:uncharacterized Fe-S cluster-containing radical SAM superfamily protein